MSKKTREERDRKQEQSVQVLMEKPHQLPDAPSEEAKSLALKVQAQVTQLHQQGAKNIQLNPIIQNGRVVSVSITCDQPKD